MKILFLYLVFLVCVGQSISAKADQYETMRASTRLLLSQKLTAVSPDLAKEQLDFWCGSFLNFFPSHVPNSLRQEIVKSTVYEARRAGLDPFLVFALIDQESNFRKYAVSPAGARGLTQIMPFWQNTIGQPEHNLFDVRTNIRYGCVILRHYIDIEQGNLSRALARYNGSLGSTKYPEAVFSALEKWHSRFTSSNKTDPLWAGW